MISCRISFDGSRLMPFTGSPSSSSQRSESRSTESGTLALLTWKYVCATLRLMPSTSNVHSPSTQHAPWAGCSNITSATMTLDALLRFFGAMITERGVR